MDAPNIDTAWTREVKPAPESLPVFGYLRVSTTEQLNGLGLEIQRQAIERWCHQRGIALAGFYSDEGHSGATELDKRQELPKLLAGLHDGAAGGLVVYRMDRLARDLIVQESILRDLWAGNYTVSSTVDSENENLQPDDPSDPMRKLIRQIVGAVAGYERDMIQLRMVQGKRMKQARGGYVGGAAPYGFQRPTAGHEGPLLPHTYEQATVSEMVALRMEGMSWEEVTVEINRRGRRNRKRKKWQKMSVMRIVKRACDGIDPNPTRLG